MRGLVALVSDNKYYYCITSLFAICLGTALLLMGKADIALWINKHHSAYADFIFGNINEVGEIWFSFFILLIIWLTKGWKTAVNVAICLFTVMLVTQFAKHILFPGELRPTAHFEGKEILRLMEGIIQLKTESFPSGHTSASFAIATALTLTVKRKFWTPLFAIVAMTVGYGRMYMLQHFINDVFTGLLIGVIVTTIAYYLNDKYLFNK